MSASEETKKHGFKLKEVANKAGVNRQLLDTWYSKRPKLFRLVVLGCVKDKEIQHDANT
jgi:hypothetical protein